MKGEIHFFLENVTYTIRKKKLIREWILNTISREGKTGGSLNIILCDDDFLSELNYKYLNHRTLTDIITFPQDLDIKHVSGEIYISLQRVRENAGKFKQSIEDELHRVMIHGVLHLIGYNDSSETGRAEMRILEEKYLKTCRTILAGDSSTALS